MTQHTTVSTTKNITQIAPNLLFMPSVFNETLQLLMDAQEYFALFGEDDQSRLEPNLRTLYSCEMSRITLRLSSVMAWLLVQRALASGKIDSSLELKQKLEFQDICLVDHSSLNSVMPSYVCVLLDRSLELYARVLRLDAQIQQIH